MIDEWIQDYLQRIRKCRTVDELADEFYEIRLEYGERLNCLYEEEMDIFSDRFEEVEDLFNRMMDGMLI